MTNMKSFTGSIGGGSSGKSSTPTRTPDNLRSKDTVEVLLGISEGPIKGLAEDLKSFFIGDTALQNSSGDYNFKNFGVTFFPGNNPAEAVTPALGGISNNQSVNLQLGSGTPVTRSTVTRGIDAIEIRLVWNQLFKSTDSGTFNADTSIRIEFKKSSEVSWSQAYNSDINFSGKTESAFAKEFRIVVPRDANDDWDIRVTKLSPENTTEYVNNVVWESYQEVIQESKVYNDTAVIQIVGEATDQFTSIPTWSGVYDGREILVPTNYDPIARTYSGVWDGSWKVAWSNNPAWIVYDFVMNDRYGMRSYYTDVNLDKFSTYAAAQWCDELVPDGKGGLQPRYTFNAEIREPRSGQELARYLAGSFNATFFDDLNGKVYLTVDKDDDAVMLFTPENVYNGEFEYSYSNINTRFNDITVTFLNPELNWAEDRRRVFDQSLIDKNGRIPDDFIAVGCTNAHEAIRRAWYRLITANTETCFVSFRTNRLGALIKPFDIILISDPDLGYGLPGRIVGTPTVGYGAYGYGEFGYGEGDRHTLTLRTPVYLEVGITYTVSLMCKDGTIFQANLVDVQPGYNSELIIHEVAPDNLPNRAVFTLSNADTVGLPRPFRVMKIEEQQGDEDQIVIEAVSLNRNKWYDADYITSSGTIQYSVLPNPTEPPGPSAVQFTERYIKDAKNFQITVSPTFDYGAYKYYASTHNFEVWSRPTGTLEAFTKQQVFYGDTLINMPSGLYDFKILGVSSLGKTTRLDNAKIFQFRVSNISDPPADIDWARLNQAELYWGYANPPGDFAGFEVRYQYDSNNTDWATAVPLHQGLLSATHLYTNQIPLSAKTLLVRAVDLFGNYSVNSAVVIRTAGDLSAVNEVTRVDYHPLFTGTKTNGVVTGGILEATSPSSDLMYTPNLSDLMYPPGELIYSIVFNDMYYEDTFSVTSAGNLYVETTLEGNGSVIKYKKTTDTQWLPVVLGQPVEVGTYDIMVMVPKGTIQGRISALSVIIDSPDVTEYFNDLVITNAASGIRLPIVNNYNTIKNVSITIQDIGTTAVGARLVDKDPVNGPLVKLVDASGAFTTGTFDAQLKGFL